MYNRSKNKFRRGGGYSGNKLPIEQVDVLDVLEEAGIPYKTKGPNIGAGWIGVCCPFCHDDNYHMGINIESKKISCFICGESGTILRLVSEEVRSFGKALELVSKLIPREMKARTFNERIAKNIRVDLPKYAVSGLSDRHKAYLKEVRGFNPDILIEKYNLFHTGPVGPLANRIIVPVVDRGRLITYTSISIAENVDNRYKHLSNEESIVYIKDYLYNLNTVRGIAYVVEGLFDCWRIGDGAVATLGTKVKDEQIKLLAKVPNVVILFDGDIPGERAGNELGEKLAPFTNVLRIPLPEGEDPDTLSEEFIQKIRRLRV